MKGTIFSRRFSKKNADYSSDFFLVGAFRRKTQTIVVTFFKNNELTDFINFISKH